MGEARRRGPKDQRIAESAERARLLEIEGAKRRKEIAERERVRQILIVKDRIESRHVTKSTRRYARHKIGRRMHSLLIPMILATLT